MQDNNVSLQTSGIESALAQVQVENKWLHQGSCRNISLLCSESSSKCNRVENIRTTTLPCLHKTLMENEQKTSLLAMIYSNLMNHQEVVTQTQFPLIGKMMKKASALKIVAKETSCI